MKPREALRIQLDYLAADGGDLVVIGVCALVHGGELALVVHLQQLESSGAVAHLVDRSQTGYRKFTQMNEIWDQSASGPTPW